MYKIVLTHGRHQEIADQPARESDASNLAGGVKDALDWLLPERRRRGHGLPDGYRIFDERGREVKAEWLPVGTHA